MKILEHDQYISCLELSAVKSVSLFTVCCLICVDRNIMQEKYAGDNL